jgi:CHAT domain-containing protein/tetratricopeptide (TPR) repeat protein
VAAVSVVRAAPSGDTARPPVISLAEGRTTRLEISRGEPTSASVSLSAGQYARVVFLWRGVDLEVSVFAPGGERLPQPPAQIRAPGPASVSVLAEAAGEYRFELRTRESLIIDGACDARLDLVRQPTPADEARLAAERALAESSQMSGGEAERKIEQALQSWRSAGDWEGEAWALHALGDLLALSKKLQPADAAYKEEQALRHKLGDDVGEAHTLLALGDAYRHLSSPEEALPYYQQALDLFRHAGDRVGESVALYTEGFALASAGRYRESLTPYADALAIMRATGDRLREARTLNALGGAHDRLGDYDRALSYYIEAAPIRRELGDRPGEVLTSSNNVGVIYDNLGDWQRAKESYEAALSAYESLLGGGLRSCVAPDATAQPTKICSYAAATLNNLGELHNSLGDPQTALDKFEQALAIETALGEDRNRRDTYSRMCYSQLLLGRADDAAKLCGEALPPDQPQAAANSPGARKQSADPVTAYAYVVAGMVQDALGNGARADVYFASALEAHAASGDPRGQALALDKAGESLTRRGEPQRALEKLGGALPLWRQTKDRNGEALTLYHLARAERDEGHLAEAHARVTEALALVESLRTNVSAQRLRASYFAQKVDFYELAVDLKMSLAKAGGLGVAAPAELVAAAFETSERAHARVLFDILAEARVEPRATGDRALDDLLARRRQLQQRLDYKATAQTRLLAANAPAAELAAVEKEIAGLAAEYDDVDAQVRKRSPRYAELTKPRPVGVADVQSRLLDERTLLLEYSLGDARSYLWVVGQSGVKSFELRGRAEIEECASRVADTLRAEQKQPGESAQSYQSRLAGLESHFREESIRLSALVLAPAAAELGDKRLLVVADGELLRVPFAALPSPEASNGANPQTASAPRVAAENDPTPLAEGHEIVNLPSASALAALRAETAGRARAPKAVAVLADPVFETNDPRLKSALKGHAPPADAHAAATPARPQALDDATRSLGAGLPRLLSSRKEGTDIRDAAPAGLAYLALGFAANRSTATDPRLGQYRIVHFATHGVFNDRQPELSGVVLSLFDEQGRPREDGFLRLPDIYDLNLPVEMVVLSACQTGLGKQVRGEGFVGLTRGFMYAGAARVVASLWKVDDEATAELMKLFYENMLRGGMSPPEALRRAQLSVRSQRHWRAPYYWAGFVLQGEWK